MDKLDKIFSTEIPEVFYDCQRQFGVNWDDVIITYYPRIHAKYKPSPDQMIHELVHITQQKEYGVKEWWAMYLQNKDFRLSQEVEAYRQQIVFLTENIEDRNQRFRAIRNIYKLLSGELYGNMVSYDEARELLS